MKEEELLFNLVLEKLGLEPFDRAKMLVDFVMCKDYHSLCDKDFDHVKSAAKSIFKGNLGVELVNTAAIYNWLFAIDKYDQLNWGCYCDNGTYKFLPHYDSHIFSDNSTCFYRVHGTAVEPHNMFYITTDYTYLKQLYDIFLSLENAISDMSWLFKSGINVPYSRLLKVLNVLSDRYYTLSNLFKVSIPQNVGFVDWCHNTYALDDEEVQMIVDMQDASSQTNRCDLYGKLEAYLTCMCEVA